MVCLGASAAAWLGLLLVWCCAVVNAQGEGMIALPRNESRYLVVREGPGGRGSPADCRRNGGLSHHRLEVGGQQALFTVHEYTDVDLEYGELEDVLVCGLTDESAALDGTLRMIVMTNPPEDSRYWIYEIMAAPHILSLQGESSPSRYDVALGGIPWTQVTRFTLVGPLQPEVRDLIRQFHGSRDPLPSPLGYQWTWVDNPNVNRAWESYGGTSVHRSILGRYPHRLSTAQALLTRLTGREREPNDGARQALRSLLDWDIDGDRDRNFPLIRRARLPSLEASAAVNADWSTIGVPTSLHVAMASGFANLAQCHAAIRSISSYLSKRPPPSKRGQQQKRGVDANECNNLEDLMQTNAAKLPKRHTEASIQDDATSCVLTSLQVRVRLVDEAWAGSDNKVYVEMGHNTRYPRDQPRFLIMDSPNRGDQATIPVNPQDAFDKPDVTIRDIAYVRIVDGDGDNLQIKDVTLDATCAASRKHIRFSKLLNSESVSHGLDIRPSEWKQSAQAKCDLAELTASVQLVDAAWAGSDDQVYLELGYSTGRQSYLLKSSPDRGQLLTKNVNVKAAAGHHVVTTNEVVYVGLYGLKANGDKSTDKLQVQNVVLEAKCAASPQVARFHTSVNEGKEVENWGTPIHPSEWVQPCDLAKMTVSVHIADESWAGTKYEMFLRLWGHNHWREYSLAKDPSRNDFLSINVNINDAFGTYTVPYDDIGFIGLISRDRWGQESDDRMLITDIELTGECAVSGAHISLKKTADNWFTVWSAAVKPQDWAGVAV